MATGNKRFPRNNNRNNSRSNNNRNNNKRICCPQCSEQINILNDDIQYSLNLHYVQSHKSLDSIDRDIERQLSSARLGPNIQRNAQSNFNCPECKESVKVFDNDIKRSLELHAQKHQRPGTRACGDDQSSTSSGRSRNSNRKPNYTKNNTGRQFEGKNVLDSAFSEMLPGLQAHRGFVFENESGEVICGLCNVKIDSWNLIADHLKTKSHEGNTISLIERNLPNELGKLKTMEYVSFYGSNLCCNLCGCKINLSSLNICETILNIIAHNTGQLHANKTGKNEPLDRPKDGMKKLNFLASSDSLINSNKHLISCEMQPQFKCKLCDKLITFDQNDQLLLKHFTSHFQSNGHIKCVKATSVLTTFKSTNQPKGGKHKLVVTKGSITCTVCSISMEPSIDTLDAHVKEIDSFTNIDWPDNLSARINKLDLNGPQQFFSGRDKGNKNVDSKVSKVNALLKCMPPPYRNVDYIVESSQGQVTCLICNCVIPSTFYNLKTHLTGNSHSKNLLSTKDELGDVSLPNNTSTSTSAKSTIFNPFIKENSLPTLNATSENDLGKVLDNLKKTDPLIRRNVSLLTKHDDNIYSCKLCKMTIPKSLDEESFKQNLISHLSGSKHAQLFANQQGSDIKLLLADPLIRAHNHNQCLRKYEESILCTLCDVPLSISCDLTTMKKCLMQHLDGQQHTNNVRKTTRDQEDFNLGTPKTAAFFSNSRDISKAQYHLGKDSEVANNATKSSNMFQIPVGQFKGPQNSSLSEEYINRLKQPINVKPNELSFELPKSRFPNSITNDLVTESFRNLPSSFQSDIAFIKKSSAVDGFLSCTVCNNNHINPPYLQKHLEEETHVQGKIAQRPASAQGHTQISTSLGQLKGLQNLGNSEEPTNKSLKPSSTADPPREQPINAKLNELNFELPKSMFSNTISTDLVTELFHKLPANLQSDIAFIKNSSPVPGFLSCTLCNLNQINPRYLQKHLEEETHVQGKIAQRPASSQGHTQISTSLGQLKGLQNVINSEEPTNKSLKPSSTTDPPRVQPINVKPNELNFELPKSMFSKTISNDLVTESFRNLPTTYQSDIAFIKNSSPVPGFLSCTLCNVNQINPRYLQKHLEEEKHMMGKISRRPASAQEDVQNSTPSKKMMHSMKNFFGFN